MAARGELEEALATLEPCFAANRPAVAAPDLAILRLEAAQIATESGEPDRARKHLTAAEEIAGGSAFRTEPILAGRLRRELAAVREKLGDLLPAERLLTSALPPLTSGDPKAAADAMNERGTVRLELLHLSEAIMDFEGSLVLLRRGSRTPGIEPSGPAAATILTNLAIAYAEENDAEHAHAAATRARVAAGTDPGLLSAADLAEAQALLRDLRIIDAEALLEHVAGQAVLGDPLRGHALLSLAMSRFDRGRMSEAATAATDAIDAYHAAHEERNPAFARAQHALGTALTALGSDVRAAAAFESASSVWRTTFGLQSVPYQMTQIELSWLDLRSDDVTAADRRTRKILDAIAQVPPPDKRPEGLATILLGLIAEKRDNSQDAILLFRRGQRLIERARGPLSPDLGFSLVRLGRLLTRLGRYTDAAPPLDRAIAIYDHVGGAGTVRLSEAVTARAELRARAGDQHGAIDDAKYAAMLLRNRVGSAEMDRDMGTDDLRRSVRELFFAQARVMLDVAPDDAAALEQAFAACQEALTTRAGEALRQTADRLAMRGDDLVTLLKNRDEALDAVQEANMLVLASSTRPGTIPGRNAPDAQEKHNRALEHLGAVNAAIDARYPKYAEFLQPAPAKLADVQGSLEPDEAMLAPGVSDDGLLLWVISRGGWRALSVPIKAAEIAKLVTRIRAGVDLDSVNGEPDKLPPFDEAAARELYKVILSPARGTGLLEGIYHLILVPDASLQSLSPHLLIDENDRWLVETYAVTIAPSVSAAVAAHSGASARSQAQLAFLGVGDILPAGPPSAASDRVTRRGPSSILSQQIKGLGRLKETAVELKTIAATYGESESSLLLREKATLRQFMDVEPKRFRIIGFSTHALMAGDFRGLSEPSIALTPDGRNTPTDGLLTASEIALLDLDADLVMLSGCNTAAPDAGPNAEGLSGLARAFLRAGARSLLVSHWSVASDATVMVVTKFAAAERAGAGGRWADALQAAMLAMINGPDKTFSHPVYWAPFVVVGR
jgi:CHAT domain-containing protein